MKKILVTDTLFIFPKHEERLLDAGFAVERINKADASESELIERVSDVSGYILGGVEYVTERVIDAASKLEAIVYCGTSYKVQVPAWHYATQKGVAIANVPHGNANAVAEWALSAALAMNRHFFELGRMGEDVSVTTAGLEGQTIGILGLGHIGTRIAEMCKVFRPAKIIYYSPTRKKKVETMLGIEYVELDKLFAHSDVVFVSISHEVGKDFIDRKKLDLMKPNALLVNLVLPEIINTNALFEALRAHKMRACSDYPMNDSRFDVLSPASWQCLRVSNAFNTLASVEHVSSEAVRSIIRLLKGDDSAAVNPEFRHYKEGL